MASHKNHGKPVDPRAKPNRAPVPGSTAAGAARQHPTDLELAKLAYRKLSPQARELFILWLRSGCPTETKATEEDTSPGPDS